MRKITRTIAVFYSVVLGFTLVTAGWGQNKEDLGAALDPERLLEGILKPFAVKKAYSDLRPIIASLENNSNYDPKLVKVLQEVKLEALTTFAGPYAARATRDLKGRGIEFHLSLLQSTQEFAAYIVSKQNLPRNPEALYFQFMKIWKQVYTDKFQEAVRQGRSPPAAAGFHLDEYLNDQLWSYYLVEYAKRAYQDILTWVVLHEVGHHYLGHLDQKIRSDRESREMELAADIWALEKMQELGYSPDYVIAFILLQSEFEEATRNFGPEAGTHPTWTRRAGVLNRLRTFKPRRKQGLDSLKVIFQSINEETDGNYLTETSLMFAHDPDRYGSNISFIIKKNQSQALAVERDGDGLVFYGRAGHGRPIKILASNPAAEVVEVVVVEPGARKGERLRAVGLGFRDPFTHHLGTTVLPGLSLRDILTLQPKDIIDSALEGQQINAESRRQAQRILARSQAQRSANWLAFTKGEMSMNEFERKTTEGDQHSMEQLRQLLGEQGFSQFQGNVLGNDVIAMGAANLLGLENVESFPAHNLLERIRGRRADIVYTGGVSAGHRFRTQGKELQSSDYKDLLNKYGLYNRKMFDKEPNAGFPNQYRIIRGQPTAMIQDDAAGLMWQQVGSESSMVSREAPDWIGGLNRARWGGHSDWRLPTIEEVMTLSEPDYWENELHIQPVFDAQQTCLWSADTRGSYRLALNLKLGFLHLREQDEDCFVRAVRSID